MEVKGLKTVIHVNQHIIKSNRKHGRTDPVITAKNSRGNFYGHTVKITGECEVMYRPEKPLRCGAHVWIETKGTVEVDDIPINETAYSEFIKNRMNIYKKERTI